MGKFVSTAILAVVALAFVNCSKDKKKTEENLAKSVATEYSVAVGKQAFQKFKLTEVNPATVKFALDSVQVDSVTAISIKEINPVKLTKQQDTVVLAANVTAQATVYTVKATTPGTPDTQQVDKPVTSETKSVQVTVTGKIVGKKLEMEVTFPKLLAAPATIKFTGMAK